MEDGANGTGLLAGLPYSLVDTYAFASKANNSAQLVIFKVVQAIISNYYFHSVVKLNFHHVQSAGSNNHFMTPNQ